MKNKSGKNILTHVACIAIIALLLLFTNADSLSVVEWIATLHSESVYLQVTFCLSFYCSFIHEKRFGHKANEWVRSFVYCFCSASVIEATGLFIACCIKFTQIGVLYLSSYENYGAYVFLLRDGMEVVFVISGILQISILSGCLSVIAYTVSLFSENAEIAIAVPMVFLMFEDLLVSVLLGSYTSTTFCLSLFQVSLVSLEYSPLPHNILVFTIDIMTWIMICYLAAAGKSESQKTMDRKIFDMSVKAVLISIVLTIGLVWLVCAGTRKFVFESNDKLNISFISNMYGNVHYTLFYGFVLLICFSGITVNGEERRSVKLSLRREKNIFLYSLIMEILQIVAFVIMFVPRINFDFNDWGKPVRVMLTGSAYDNYEIIAGVDKAIVNRYAPGIAILMSVVMNLLATFLMGLIYYLLEFLINKKATVFYGIFSCSFIRSYKVPLYRIRYFYLAPLQWARLSLHDNNYGGYIIPNVQKCLLMLFAAITGCVLIIICKCMYNKRNIGGLKFEKSN